MTAPSVPQNVQAASGSNYVDVSWTPPADSGGVALSGYLLKLYRRAAPTVVVAQAAGVTGSPYRFSGLQPGDTYFATVSATNQANLTGPAGTSNDVLVLLPGTLTKEADKAVYGVGDVIRYTISFTNPNPVAFSGVTVVDPLPAEVALGTVDDDASVAGVRVPSLTVAGVPCPEVAAAGGLRCVLVDGSIRVENATVGAGATTQIVFDGVTVSDGLACRTVTNVATATSLTGVVSATKAVDVCGSSLGLEKWWTFDSTSLGSDGAASVNVANGNLVVQQLDGTPIQTAGRLAFVVRRTYNSQDVPIAALSSSFGLGWRLNVNHVAEDDLDLISAGYLHVPSLPADELVGGRPVVTVVDRDGTRHPFRARALATAVDTSTAPTNLATIVPRLLQAPAGLRACVDVAFDPPPGVHLGMWRYIAVNDSDAARCVPQAGGPAPVVLGYAAVRPDRLRYE